MNSLPVYVYASIQADSFFRVIVNEKFGGFAHTAQEKLKNKQKREKSDQKQMYKISITSPQRHPQAIKRRKKSKMVVAFVFRFNNNNHHYISPDIYGINYFHLIYSTTSERAEKKPKLFSFKIGQFGSRSKQTIFMGSLFVEHKVMPLHVFAENRISTVFAIESAKCSETKENMHICIGQNGRKRRWTQQQKIHFSVVFSAPRDTACCSLCAFHHHPFDSKLSQFRIQAVMTMVLICVLKDVEQHK